MRFLIQLVFVCFLVCFTLSDAFAQTPETINYQAVARNSQTGLELANTPIFISIMIRSNGPNGTIVFQENHSGVSTDDFGLFAIQIGSGSPVIGSLGSINWATGTYWLDSEVDAGDGLQSAGTMQLVSVPYALHARTADNVDDDDADPINELVENLTVTDEGILLLEQNNGTNNFSVDLSTISDGDSDPTNELVNEFSFDQEDRDLFLAQNDGSNFTVNIGGVDDADADPTNELVNDFSFNSATRTLNLAQNDGSSFSANIGGVDDADADPTNEFVESLTFEVDTRILTLTQGEGPTQSVEIPNPDLLWEFNEGPNTVYNDQNKIGIGLDNPNARLTVQAQSSSENGLEIQTNEEDIIFEAGEDGIGLGGENNSNSDVHIEGSKSVSFRNFEGQLLPSELTIEPEDFLVIINFPSILGSSVEVIMPNPADFPGREIIIKRIGAAGSLTLGVLFEFGGANVNGSSPSGQNISPFSTADTRWYVSAGSLGWITLH